MKRLISANPQDFLAWILAGAQFISHTKKPCKKPRLDKTANSNYHSSERRNRTMSTHPRLEARMSVQERRQTNLEARVEELSEDISDGFKQISEYFGKIEATMATKEDIASIKEDIINVKGDITDIKEEITDIKLTIATLNQNTVLLLTQILERLPKSEK